jgi:hypothetical protein
MSQGDVRAVDNPISAIFDLSEEVNREIPRIRKLVTYATVFIGVWLVINFLLILAVIFRELIIGALLVVFFVIGILALAMLRNLGDFMKYYAVRHAAIVRVRNDDPVIYAPKGETAVLRLFAFIRLRNPVMDHANPHHQFQSPAILKGRTGLFYNFDGYLPARAGALWRIFGAGYPGYQLFIKHFQNAPRAEDLAALKQAAEDVSSGTHLPVSRAIALWSRKGEQNLSDEAYNYLGTATIYFSHWGKRYATALELIVENEDGSYEFMPYIADGHGLPGPRAQ